MHFAIWVDVVYRSNDGIGMSVFVILEFGHKECGAAETLRCVDGLGRLKTGEW